MLNHVYRTIIIYFFVLLVVRLMGKREVGQLSPFDLVVAIIIAELAAIPMESSDIPLWHGILPVVVLGFLEVGFSYLALRNRKIRLLIDGRAQVIIKNGRLMADEMRRSRYNLDDLLTQLREAGMADIGDVEFAVLETSGKLTVVPRSQKRPVTPADLGLTTEYEGLPAVLVMDGQVLYDNLRQAGLNEGWLAAELGRRGLVPEQVLLASLGTDGRLFISERGA
ncbi:MAG: DUF421 domain-containing protein [Peptococcaceae bacterium]|jgi:uncharacterized membrane protein YcaP (DUF421 family)|nr:DUF421 domain-containing protein [Peptococcaceae bacterium]